MGLLLPLFRFANEVDTMTGTPPASDPGVTFTTGAANVDGTAVTLLSALAFDCHYLVVGFSGTHVSTTDHNALADILADPGGGTSWTSIIDDLSMGMLARQGAEACAMSCWYHFPLFIAAGNSIGLRARSTVGGLTTGRCVVYAYGNPSKPELWWCGSKVETLGSVPSTSKGTAVTPGASGTFGSWTTIGTSGARYGAYQIGISGNVDATPVAGTCYWQIGISSAQIPGTQTIWRTFGAGSGGHIAQPGGPSWCDIPTGTVLQLRNTFDTTGPEAINATIHGVY